jgi:hypothetical protein
MPGTANRHGEPFAPQRARPSGDSPSDVLRAQQGNGPSLSALVVITEAIKRFESIRQSPQGTDPGANLARLDALSGGVSFVRFGMFAVTEKN